MNSFVSFGLKQAYSRLAKLGDPLAEANTLLEWEKFRSIEEGLYDNRTEQGGHPNIDFVLMIKILVLQHWYGLSDQKMEREPANNLSFMNFLGYPETISDSTTIWLFRERLKEKNRFDAIWQEVQRQLWSAPLRVDNKLSNFHSWRDVDEENEAALRPGIQDISSG
jgi:IS5 family transposase